MGTHEPRREMRLMRRAALARADSLRYPPPSPGPTPGRCTHVVERTGGGVVDRARLESVCR